MFRVGLAELLTSWFDMWCSWVDCTMNRVTAPGQCNKLLHCEKNDSKDGVQENASADCNAQLLDLLCLLDVNFGQVGFGDGGVAESFHCALEVLDLSFVGLQGYLIVQHQVLQCPSELGLQNACFVHNVKVTAVVEHLWGQVLVLLNQGFEVGEAGRIVRQLHQDGAHQLNTGQVT